MEAINATCRAAYEAFDDAASPIIFNLFHFPVNEPEDYCKGPYDREQQGSKRERSTVVADAPPKTTTQGEGAVRVLSWREIPGAHGGQVGVPEEPNDELHYPEEHENA